MVTDVKNLPIQFDRDRVVAFCRDRGIIRLSVFGSVLRDDFDPARSDIDVLADFKPEATRSIGFRFFGYGDELAGFLGRRVDFCSRLDPRLEPTVRREAFTISQASRGGRITPCCVTPSAAGATTRPQAGGRSRAARPPAAR